MSNVVLAKRIGIYVDIVFVVASIGNKWSIWSIFDLL